MQERDEVDLIEYLNVLWKWKWLIVGGTLIAAIGSFVLASQAPLTYEASVTLLSAPPRLPGTHDVSSCPMVTPDTFVEIMKAKSLAPDVVRHFSLDKPPHKVTVDSFVSRVLSVKRLEDTDLIRVTVTLLDPQLAAEVADFLAQKAVELQAGLSRGGAQASRDFFRKQRDQARQVVERSRTRLMDFRRATNLDSLEIEQRIAMEENPRLQVLAAEVITEQAGLRTRNQKLSEVLKQEELTPPVRKSIVADPSSLAAPPAHGATDMKGLSSLQLKSEEVNATYQDIRRGLIDAEASLASLESQRKVVERRLEENKTRLAEIGQRIASVKPKLEELAQSYLQAQATYQFWNRKDDEAVLFVAARPPELTIIDSAIAPREPISQRVKQKVALAVAMTVITCAFLAFFMEYLLRVRQRQGVVR